MGRFAGRRLAVTGAGSGIGRATVERLCAEGASVLALDLVFPQGGVATAECLTVDVRDEVALMAIAAGCEGLDGLATFAGVEMGGRIDTLPLSGWEKVFDINLFGSVRAVKAFLPALRARQGAVLLCSSQLSMAGGRDCVAYAASKGAINALCRSLAVDHAAEGVRVNAIAPGATETPMMDRAFEGEAATALREASRQRHAMGRFGRAGESAEAALFLLDHQASSFVTGTVLAVDGGWLAA